MPKARGKGTKTAGKTTKGVSKQVKKSARGGKATERTCIKCEQARSIFVSFATDIVDYLDGESVKLSQEFSEPSSNTYLLHQALSMKKLAEFLKLVYFKRYKEMSECTSAT